jgi:hypothetical protein
MSLRNGKFLSLYIDNSTLFDLIRELWLLTLDSKTRKYYQLQNECSSFQTDTIELCNKKCRKLEVHFLLSESGKIERVRNKVFFFVTQESLISMIQSLLYGLSASNGVSTGMFDLSKFDTDYEYVEIYTVPKSFQDQILRVGLWRR